ncbi:ankyrin [Polychaeton citri CBS 116435]|uniref:Ankyrin n=1 Tax=Polychaeton citri CBS 116435 TaxID=1314669 RepID=A0A9P4UT42_9PEZI|nr:ankyrin [Polychaeton citri CBS 116435]
MIDPSTRLRRAIYLNDALLVQRIVRINPKLLCNPDFEDKSNTSLHLAAQQGSATIAEFLITSGHEDGEISRNTDHDTPLMLAARNGHVDVATFLAKQFPRCVVYTNKVGQDALAIASQRPASTALIPMLLSISDEKEHCASVHSRDVEGNTALHHASASGSLKALRLLLAAGANPLAKNNYDWTPLAYSQTVAAEVYFKNLVAEFERKKIEGAKQGEEKEKQKAAGLRLVSSEDDGKGGTGHVENVEDEVIGDVLRRQWSPVERRRPGTPGANPRHEWVSPKSSKEISRHRAGSGE